VSTEDYAHPVVCLWMKSPSAGISIHEEN
jgi:hypothetical protein